MQATPLEYALDFSDFLRHGSRRRAKRDEAEVRYA